MLFQNSRLRLRARRQFDFIAEFQGVSPADQILTISNAGIGFYLGIMGFLLILFNVLNVLITNEKDKDGN